ncbi:MAG: hypothetical protein ACRC42_00570, partial [Mycoplasma sp.]
LLKLIELGKIKNNIAKKALEKMILTGKSVNDLSEEDLKVFTEDELMKICNEAVKSNSKAVKDYASGKNKVKVNCWFCYEKYKR